MKINITAGSFLNEKLENIYENETFIPFCETMIIGTYNHKLFSIDFIEERAKTHNVSVSEYEDKLSGFITFLKCVNIYDEVILWFGDEPFCKENRRVVLQTLNEYNFQGKIILNIVNEETLEILEKIIVQ